MEWSAGQKLPEWPEPRGHFGSHNYILGATAAATSSHAAN